VNIINRIKDKAKENIKTIVLPEADDIRTLKAARIITDEGFAKVILVGDKDTILNIFTLLFTAKAFISAPFSNNLFLFIIKIIFL